MNTAISIVFAIAAALLPAAGTSAAADVPAADTILVNGRVYTPTGRQEAVALGNGRILATGSNTEIRRLASPGAQTLDLQGKTVLPGLFDMHVHPMMAGNGAEGVCRIAQGASAAQLLSVVAECVKAEGPGRWVTGAQWQAVSMGDTPITRQTLDSVSPDNPVMLFDISGHSVWANSRALQVAGITRDTSNPTGGIIERDAQGEPTGILRETARDLVLRHVPAPTPEQNVAALRSGLALLLSKGVTALTDAMVFREDLVAYDTLADKGELHQTIRTCIAYSHAGKPVAGFEELLASRQTFARAKLRPDCVKVFTDGVPTESHTAAMLEPYADDQPNAPARGMLLVDPAVLNPAVARWDKMGLTVLFHAAGDGAVRAALDAIEFARTANGMGGPRHQVGHSTFMARQDIPRARPMNATIEFSPYLWYPTPINDDIIKAIGAERIERVWPLRDGIESGALVVAGSDWAVVPDPDPWLAIETSLTRKAPGGGGGAFGPGQAITLDQAIDMFTINAARQMGVDDRLGTIEAGKQADFIVIDRDPFRMPVTDLHTIKVEQTYVGGRKVFDRSVGATAD